MSADKRQKFFRLIYNYRCLWPGMLNLPKITSLLFLCIIIRKKWVIKLIFCMKISINVCYKFILWFWWAMVKHSQSPQNSKFAMFLQYLKKEVRDDVDFFHADKYQSFLQVDFNTFGIRVSFRLILSLLLGMGMFKNYQSTQNNKFGISWQYL